MEDRADFLFKQLAAELELVLLLLMLLAKMTRLNLFLSKTVFA